MSRRIDSENRYRNFISNIEGYEYINCYFKGDVLPDGKLANNAMIEVKHNYCGCTYVVLANSFMRAGSRCTNCCRKYEDSIEYYIKNELNLDPYEIFNYKKSNPKILSKKSEKKIWIKCNQKDYHEDSFVTCSNLTRSLIRGFTGCPYCSNRKIHPKDSFAQYHIDNTDPDFLEKYWDYEKNTVDPFGISPASGGYVWIKCQEKDYHGSYKIKVCNFKLYVKNKNKGCLFCTCRKVHPLDSFGYHNFDKVQSWHPDNEISPFRVPSSTAKKYKFVCHECGKDFLKQLNNIKHRQDWCPHCSSSRGERVISSWLNNNGVENLFDKSYFKDLLSDKGNPLRPDFILPDHKIWIEYDGEFHYHDFYKDGSYELQQCNDKLKDEYAKKYGWKLIRIPYWDFDNIEDILKREIIVSPFLF